MKYLLVDSLNMFFRARHVVGKKLDPWTKVGMAIHISLTSINKSWIKEGADHVVFCLEGRSWRKEIYSPYKNNRKQALNQRSEREVEEDEVFFEVYQKFIDFITTKTNCTVLQCDIAEADDLIARWIDKHPNDEHCIVSSDSDFAQLIDNNVHQYNGIANQLITLEGYFDDRGNLIKDKKTGDIKEAPDPEWLLFEKCIRGDTSDNIFSAYPGVRKKGTKNKVGLEEAFQDRKNKGFNWNNFMLQKWTDHKDVEHLVLDDYQRNRMLIDLRNQPEPVKEYIDEIINQASVVKSMPKIGREFLKFCGTFDLKNLSENSESYVEWMRAPYVKSV